MTHVKYCIALVLTAAVLAGCSPEVGSDAWCEALKEKPKSDWSANEAKDFGMNCIIK